LLVNDMQEIETPECRLSFGLFGHRLTRAKVEGSVSMSLNPAISGREEVGFYCYSKAINTHNSSKRRSLLTLCL